MKLRIFHDTRSHLVWAVRLVEPGDKYGLNDCLTCDKGDAYVEFYDTRYEHTDLGQFVTRYYLSTLLKFKSGGGLCLKCDVPSWSVGEACMNRIRDWLRRGA